MRFYIDTEFIESGPTKPIQLISIGIVAEDGREFYAASSDFDPDTASEWVKTNVLSKLGKGRSSPKSIADKLLAFVWPNWPPKGDPSMMSPRIRDEAREKPEFWGYYADYDWVVFCQLFGTMMDLPKGWPMFCRDLKQLAVMINVDELPKQVSTEHNALADARWNKIVFNHLEARLPQGCSV